MYRTLSQALIALGMLAFFSGCDSAISNWVGLRSGFTPSPNSGTNLEPVGTAVLKSYRLTRKNKATFEIACGNETNFFQVSSSRPTASQGGWQSCSSSTSTVLVDLIDGYNELKFWYKSTANLVSNSSNNFLVRKGDYFLVNSPDLMASSKFGAETILALSSNRILITDTTNPTNGSQAGAVHIFDEIGKLVKSIYGSTAGDYFGGDTSNVMDKTKGKTVAFANGYFAVVSPSMSIVDNSNATVPDGGAISVYSSDGDLIFQFKGQTALDLEDSSIIRLSNGNYVIGAPKFDVGGVVDAGAVRLINGNSGSIIASINGDNTGDQISYPGLADLENGNFVIRSTNDDVSGVSNAGSIQVINGATGVILSSIVGETASDEIGGSTFKVLSNHNFVAISPSDDVSGIVNGGSVKLVNGFTGAVIASIEGNNANDNLGNFNSGIELPNGNFLISSRNDDTPGATNGGSAKLVNGTTGLVIASIEGDNNNDEISSLGFEVLANGNFVINSVHDTVSGITAAGSARLIDGTSGVELWSVAGNAAGDWISRDYSRGLTNGNYTVCSALDALPGVAYAGSVKLINGANGNVITSIEGNNASDQIGIGRVSTLDNGNFIIPSYLDDVAGVTDAGSVMLVDGVSGNILANISGDNANDRIGGSNPIRVLSGNYFVISSPSDTIGALASAGSAKLVNGTSGALIASFDGDVASESFGGSAFDFSATAFLLGSSADDGVGSIKLIEKATGTILSTVKGDNSGDGFGFLNSPGKVRKISDGSVWVYAPGDDVSGVVDAGSFILFPGD